LIEDYTGVPKLGGPEKAQMSGQNKYHLVWLSPGELRDNLSIFPREGVAKLLAEFDYI
jgi:hypothetical protein